MVLLRVRISASCGRCCSGVYLLNASAVVMNYQFVNALVFTIAGILAAQAAGQETRASARGSEFA